MSIHSETFDIPQSTQADIKNTGWEIVESTNEETIDGLAYETTDPAINGEKVIPNHEAASEAALAKIKAAKIGGFLAKRYKDLHMEAA